MTISTFKTMDSTHLNQNGPYPIPIPIPIPMHINVKQKKLTMLREREREIEKYTSWRKVVEDVCELEGAVTNVEGVMYTMPTMCHLVSLCLPCWVPFHHLRPCLPR